MWSVRCSHQIGVSYPIATTTAECGVKFFIRLVKLAALRNDLALLHNSSLSMIQTNVQQTENPIAGLPGTTT